MSWEDEFSADTLKNGYKMYQNGDVKEMKRKGDVYTFRFGWGYYYSETTLTKKSEEYIGSCSCYNFRREKGCEHLVAARYKLEESLNRDRAVTKQTTEKRGKTSPKIIYPFSKSGSAKATSAQEYRYFNMPLIAKNVTITEENYDLAQQLLSEKRIELSGARLFPYHTESGTAANGMDLRMSLHEKDSEKTSLVHLETGRNLFWKCSCNARRCYYEYSIDDYRRNEKTLCEHVVAAMIVLADMIEKENPGDATDYQAQKLLGMFRRKNTQSSEKQQTIFLQPELQNDDGELRAGFRIGTTKAYKVRNLTDLVKKVQNNETYPLGTKGLIDFAQSEFDEASNGLYSFIQNRVRDNQQRNERIEARRSWGYSYFMTETISETIPLEGTAIDEFYELCKPLGEFPYVEKKYGGKSTKGAISCAEGRPQITLKMEELREENQVAGIIIDGHMPELCQGLKGAYYADAKHLYRSTKDDYEQMRPLMELSDEYGDMHFRVGRRSLAEFYGSVLPILKDIALIEDRATEKIKACIPPTPEVLFYLDSVDNVLSCRPQVTYGEQTHSPMDAKYRKGYSEIYRDYAREREICETVDKYFPIYDEVSGESYCDDSSLCYEVYHNGVDELLQLGEIQCTDSFQNRHVRSSFGLKIGVSVESDLLNLEITSTELSREELMAVFESYRLKKKYHVLKNGDFIDLAAEDLSLMDQLLGTCNAQLKDVLGDKIQIPAYRALYLDKLLEEKEEIYSHRDRTYRRLIKDFGAIKDSDLDVPESLEDVLRPYQTYGHKWLRTILGNRFGGILADEMGLGKTLQMISVLLAEKEAQNAENPCTEAKGTDAASTALIVTPASLVYNWREEFSRFAPSLKVAVVAQGIKERRNQIRSYDEYDVLITSYDLLKRDISEYQECEFAYQIIDEAQYIKNPKTTAAKTVKVIHAKHRFALTGTPIENRLSELWSIFDYLMPGFLYEYETFRRELETPIAKDKNAEASDRLKKMVAPFILRRLKGDVLKDLPSKIEEIRYGVMDSEQRHLYDAQVQRISKQIEKESDEDFKRGKLQILAELTRTRQLCCDPSLVVENYEGGSAKREACIDLIQSAIEGEHRILLFSQFTTMLGLLAEDLKEKGIDYYMLTGDTPKEERIRLMKAFNEGEVPVFLISLKAGGTGLNLTGADIVIHYDPWWNLAVQNQATDRAHRIGQLKTVTVYKLIIKDSIEEKIIKLQETKKDLADAILSGENGTLAGLSKEELLELLG